MHHWSFSCLPSMIVFCIKDSRGLACFISLTRFIYHSSTLAGAEVLKFTEALSHYSNEKLLLPINIFSSTTKNHDADMRGDMSILIYMVIEWSGSWPVIFLRHGMCQLKLCCATVLMEPGTIKKSFLLHTMWWGEKHWKSINLCNLLCNMIAGFCLSTDKAELIILLFKKWQENYFCLSSPS